MIILSITLILLPSFCVVQAAEINRIKKHPHLMVCTKKRSIMRLIFICPSSLHWLANENAIINAAGCGFFNILYISIFKNIFVLYLLLGWFLLSLSQHQTNRSLAQVVSEWIRLKDTTSCLTLWYHMDSRSAKKDYKTTTIFASYSMWQFGGCTLSCLSC